MFFKLPPNSVEQKRFIPQKRFLNLSKNIIFLIKIQRKFKIKYFLIEIKFGKKKRFIENGQLK